MTRTRVCALDELAPDRAKRFVVNDMAIAIVRDSAGAVHAIGDRCTHGDISVSEGFVEGDTIECWAHGSRFSLLTGQPQNLPAYEPVPVFPVVVLDGEVYLNTEEGSNPHVNA